MGGKPRGDKILGGDTPSVNLSKRNGQDKKGKTENKGKGKSKASAASADTKAKKKDPVATKNGPKTPAASQSVFGNGNAIESGNSSAAFADDAAAAAS